MEKQLVHHAETKECPVCSRPTSYGTRVNYLDDISVWYYCSCGVAFQSEEPKKNVYNKKYYDNAIDKKFWEQKKDYEAYCYAPLLEEMCSARKMIEVGWKHDASINYFMNRGWVTHRYDIKVDFSNVKLTQYSDAKVNLIWMSNVFETFTEPHVVLSKCDEILTEDGVIYISTPDLDAINMLTPTYFPYWTKDENYIIWSERALTRELERLGFNIVLKRRNYTDRFANPYTIQIIAQKVHY